MIAPIRRSRVQEVREEGAPEVAPPGDVESVMASGFIPQAAGAEAGRFEITETNHAGDRPDDPEASAVSNEQPQHAHAEGAGRDETRNACRHPPAGTRGVSENQPLDGAERGQSRERSQDGAQGFTSVRGQCVQQAKSDGTSHESTRDLCHRPPGRPGQAPPHDEPLGGRDRAEDPAQGNGPEDGLAHRRTDDPRRDDAHGSADSARQHPQEPKAPSRGRQSSPRKFRMNPIVSGMMGSSVTPTATVTPARKRRGPAGRSRSPNSFWSAISTTGPSV